jgi:hypothetical protein
MATVQCFLGYVYRLSVCRRADYLSSNASGLDSESDRLGSVHNIIRFIIGSSKLDT